MEKRHTLVDNADAMRYEFDLGDATAFIEYVPSPGCLVLTHTEVPRRYEGRGIGRELVQAVLEDIRDNKQVQIVPQCPFIAVYIRRHPEWNRLVLSDDLRR